MRTCTDCAWKELWSLEAGSNGWLGLPTKPEGMGFLLREMPNRKTKLHLLSVDCKQCRVKSETQKHLKRYDKRRTFSQLFHPCRLRSVCKAQKRECHAKPSSSAMCHIECLTSNNTFTSCSIFIHAHSWYNMCPSKTCASQNLKASDIPPLRLDSPWVSQRHTKPQKIPDTSWKNANEVLSEHSLFTKCGQEPCCWTR